MNESSLEIRNAFVRKVYTILCTFSRQETISHGLLTCHCCILVVQIVSDLLRDTGFRWSDNRPDT